MTIYKENNKEIQTKNKEGFLTEISIALSDCLTKPSFGLAVLDEYDSTFEYVLNFFEDKEIYETTHNKEIILNNGAVIIFVKTHEPYEYKIHKVLINDKLLSKEDKIYIENLIEYTLPF